MGLFDAFSGSAGRKAALATANQIQQTQNAVLPMLYQGQGQAIEGINQAQPLSLNALGAGLDLTRGALNRGYTTGREDYDRASHLYDPYAQTGQKGFNMYANSMGLNGPEGYKGAVDAFSAGPGYQWAVDQATGGLMRKQASLGTLGGGNTMAGVTTLAHNLANQEYGNWRQGLQWLGNTGYQATGAQARLAQGQGDLATGYGQNLAGVESDYAKNVANLYSGDARAKAGVFGNTTALGVNALTDLGKLQAQNTNSGMLAGQQASANSLATALKLAEIGGKMFYGAKG